MAATKPKLTLVQKRTANSAIADESGDEAEFLEDLRGVIWGKAGAIASSFKALAAEAKLSDRTIQRFASGETKRPNLFTIRRLLKAAGWRMTWAREPRVPVKNPPKKK